jgi:hypothetical protein
VREQAMSITQKDILETILGLQRIADDLRKAAESSPLPNFKKPTVPVQITGLLNHSSYLTQVAEELRQLIPDEEVKIPKK